MEKEGFYQKCFGGFYQVVKAPSSWPFLLSLYFLIYLLLLTAFYFGYQIALKSQLSPLIATQIKKEVLMALFVGQVFYFFILTTPLNALFLTSTLKSLLNHPSFKKKIKILCRVFYESLLIKVLFLSLTFSFGFLSLGFAVLLFFISLSFVTLYETIALTLLLSNISKLTLRHVLKKESLKICCVALIQGVALFFSFLTILLWLFFMPGINACARKWAKELKW